MVAHVICCNDSVEAVVIGNQSDALIKKEEMSKDAFEKVKWQYGRDYERYCHTFFWHIHTVSCFKK